MAKVIWLTGISGSGKTTLGLRLKEELQKRYGRVEFIDGDTVREFFEDDLGYTRDERISNIKRIAFAAMLLGRNQTHVIVANIAPYYEARDFVRRHIKDYIQIYLRITPEEAAGRDVKGYYARHKSGELKNMVGLDETYDEPRNPDLIVDTGRETADESLKKILAYLNLKGI